MRHFQHNAVNAITQFTHLPQGTLNEEHESPHTAQRLVRNVCKVIYTVSDNGNYSTTTCQCDSQLSGATEANSSAP